MKKKQIVTDVGAALIERDGRFLIAQRHLNDRFGGLWEFPGGAVEKGETKEAATKREIEEEIGVRITLKKLLLVIEDEIPQLKIIIYLFLSSIESGAPAAVDCRDIRWVTIPEMGGFDMAPADKKIVKWLEASYENLIKERT